ncbi:hypothetical protein H4Q26_014743 [Puccinia striiformis f. sp. tritici PST-130]|nr:hypothetical protein H4Q26_014743 [Puccinia striiformis f. sp. tritici PST-130]
MASSVFEFAKKNLGSQLHASGREIHLRILDTGLTITPYSISLRMSPLSSQSTNYEKCQITTAEYDHLTKILVSKLDSLVHCDLTKKALIDREITPEERATRSDHTPSTRTMLLIITHSLTNSKDSAKNAAEIVGVGGSSNNKLPKGPLREILNCVRVLTRILPLLMEEAASNDPTSPTSTSFSTHEGNSNNKSHNEKAVWINNLLWGTQQQDSKAEEDLQRSQFVLDEDDQDDQDSSETVKLVQEINQKTLSSTNLNSDCTTNEDKPALMVTLIDTILDLLFLPGLLNTSLAPIKSNYSSPSNTLNTIANGIGRMTSSRKSLGGSSSFDPLEPNHTNANASPNNTRRPSLTTQLSSSGNSSSIYYGGASSAGISQDLPGWSAALLSINFTFNIYWKDSLDHDKSNIYMFRTKDSISPKSGLVKLCAITLQLLTSQDRKELAHLINSKVDLPVGIRAQYSVPGTLADFLIVSICSVIFSTISSASSPSPDLNSLSSNSLSKLFLILSTPSFLLKEESNVKLLYYVLECFNKIESLGKFTLKEGIKEIERLTKRRSLNQIKGGNETPRLSRRGSTRTITSLMIKKKKQKMGKTGDKIFDVDDHEFDKGKGKMRDNHQHSTSTMIDPQQYNNLGSTSTSISGSSSSDQFQVQGGGEGSRKSSMNIDRSSTLSHSSENWSHHHSKKNSASSGIDLDNLSSSASSFSTSVPVKSPRLLSAETGSFLLSLGSLLGGIGSLPLDTIQIMVTELKPKVIGEGSNKVETQPSAQSLNLLRSATLLGMIPQPDKSPKKPADSNSIMPITPKV